jgi:hypothetical protein
MTPPRGVDPSGGKSEVSPLRNRTRDGHVPVHVPVPSQHSTSDTPKYRVVARTASGNGQAPVSTHNPIILTLTQQI